MGCMYVARWHGVIACRFPLVTRYHTSYDRLGR